MCRCARRLAMWLKVAALVVFIVGPPMTAARAQTAADDLTVDALIQRALDRHPDLEAAKLDVEAAQGRVRQAGLRPNPMLDLGGQKALGPDNNIMVGITLPLDLNGRKEGRVGLAERELEMRRAQLADRERKLRGDLRLKAAEVLAARRNLRTIRDLVETNRRAVEIVGARVREGAVPSLDLNVQLVEANRLEASETLLASRVEILTLQLKTLAGMPADSAINLVGDLAAIAAPPEQSAALQTATSAR